MNRVKALTPHRSWARTRVTEVGRRQKGQLDVPHAASSAERLRVCLLTGGGDWHYAIPLADGLARQPLTVELLGGDQFLSSPCVRQKGIEFVNTYGNGDAGKPLLQKVRRIVRTYFGLAVYALRTESQVFHLLWHNKFAVLDRTVLAGYYKLMRKKLVVTAHNVDDNARDGRSGVLARASLKCIYRLADCIFVHTSRMKQQLVREFAVHPSRVVVIPFGINTVVPNTSMTRDEARRRLQLLSEDRVMLFFGNIAAYKGVEHLVRAFELLYAKYGRSLKLIIAGAVKSQAHAYWQSVQDKIQTSPARESILREVRFIKDGEIEVFFKASDVCMLPYVNIFQSGVLFLSYRFGLPVIATAVGSLSEDIVEGKTGFICEPNNPEDLARATEVYFASPLFHNLAETREAIASMAMQRYSWDAVAATTFGVYERVVGRQR